MDMNPGATEIDVAERMRFDSFKLGNGSSSDNTIEPNHRHARSRSRNLSLSSSISLPFNPSTNKSVSDTSPVSPSFPPTSSGTSSKRSSHHRRRSSVSTRHESADMMGVPVTDLPLSLSDDNINLGDKDSVRRRALWALEGKSDDHSFSKVEIPDITIPDINKKFELPSKPSFSTGLNNGASKRDSFGKHLAASASAKELLHTLVEEDEEDEGDDSMVTLSPADVSPVEYTVRAPIVNDVSSPSPITRPRPASLNLRPLSLNKENIIGLGSLPTPVTPVSRPGLRSLTLATLPNISSTINNMNDNIMSMRRSSLTVTSTSPPVAPHPRRPSLNLESEPNFESPAVTHESAKRKASISYRCSTDHAYAQFTLPTPELTPILDRPRSISSVGSALDERPLSETEQHFLYQAHATLTQRIIDLERALAASHPYPRSVSCASDVPSSAPEEPSDEMLQLVADLKTERDELSKDVEGWRMRVSDLEKQIGVLARRVDLERREAWVARERSSLLEVEKHSLEKSLEAKKVELQDASAKYEAIRTVCDAMKCDCERLKEELESRQEVQNECERLRATLAEETQKREKLEAERLSTTPTHANIANYHYPSAYIRRGPQFQSIDSEATDVEPVDDFQMNLKSVVEEREDFSDEEDNELSKYEDEDGDDFSFQSNMASPVDSLDGMTESAPRAPEPTQGHHRRSSSSVKSWTFPQDARAYPAPTREVEVDKFFGCLDYDESAPQQDVAVSCDNGRSLFSRSLLESDDSGFPPFLLPADVGVEVPEAKPILEAVMEEEEEVSEDDQEKFDGEQVDGGIVFKFSPPEDSDVSSELQTPSPGPEKRAHIFNSFEEDDEDGLFRFPRMVAPITPPAKPSAVRKSVSPVTPSSIPRSVSLRNYTPTATLERLVIKRNPVNDFVTPPTKRGGTMPTFIPQPRASPVANPAVPTFIRQPKRASTVPVSVKPVPGPSSMPQPKFRVPNTMIPSRQ